MANYVQVPTVTNVFANIKDYVRRASGKQTAFGFESRSMQSQTHRRRIKTEEKAKAFASVWGEEFIQFHAALAIFPRTIICKE